MRLRKAQIAILFIRFWICAWVVMQQVIEVHSIITRTFTTTFRKRSGFIVVMATGMKFVIMPTLTLQDVYTFDFIRLIVKLTVLHSSSSTVSPPERPVTYAQPTIARAKFGYFYLFMAVSSQNYKPDFQVGNSLIFSALSVSRFYTRSICTIS